MAPYSNRNVLGRFCIVLHFSHCFAPFSHHLASFSYHFALFRTVWHRFRAVLHRFGPEAFSDSLERPTLRIFSKKFEKKFAIRSF